MRFLEIIRHLPLVVRSRIMRDGTNVLLDRMMASSLVPSFGLKMRMKTDAPRCVRERTIQAIQILQ